MRTGTAARWREPVLDVVVAEGGEREVCRHRLADPPVPRDKAVVSTRPDQGAIADRLAAPRHGQPKDERRLVARVVVAREPPGGDLRFADGDRASRSRLERRLSSVQSPRRMAGVAHADRRDVPRAQRRARPDHQLVSRLREQRADAVDPHLRRVEHQVEADARQPVVWHNSDPGVARQQADARLVPHAHGIVAGVVARIAGIREVSVANARRSLLHGRCFGCAHEADGDSESSEGGTRAGRRGGDASQRNHSRCEGRMAVLDSSLSSAGGDTKS